MCAAVGVLPAYGEGGGAGDRLGLNSNFCVVVELFSVSMPSTNLCRDYTREREHVRGM